MTHPIIDITQWIDNHREFDPDTILNVNHGDDRLTQASHAVRAIDAPPSAAPAWRVRALLPDGDFLIVAGEDGVSKSTAALHVAAAIAGGYPAFDHFDTLPGPVLIVSEEDDQGTLLIRLEALIAGHRWDRERVLSNVHVMALEGICIGDRQWQERLAHEVLRTHASLLVLDPLAELIDGDENDNSAARPILKWIRSLPCATMIVHHFGKAVEGRSAGDRIRGASAWRRGARAILAMEALPESDRIRVKPIKLTKARKHPPFVISRAIEADPENDAAWRRAKLTFETDRHGRLEGAQAFVLARIDECEDGMLSTDLRTSARGSGFSGENIASAIKKLHEAEIIQPGRLHDDHANAKRWQRRNPV